MTVLKNFGALNAEMFVGVCLTGGALLLGIVGVQFFNSRKAGSKKYSLSSLEWELLTLVLYYWYPDKENDIFCISQIIGRKVSDFLYVVTLPIYGESFMFIYSYSFYSRAGTQ